MPRDYEQSEMLESLAKKIIEEHHPHLQRASIAYVMKEVDKDKKPRLPAGRAGKYKAMARARAVPSLYHCICGFDFILEVDELYWRLLGVEQREALIDHELCHMIRDEDGWYVRDHDIEEFRDIIERRGFWQKGYEAFFKASQSYLPFDGVSEVTGHAVQ